MVVGLGLGLCGDSEDNDYKRHQLTEGDSRIVIQCIFAIKNLQKLPQLAATPETVVVAAVEIREYANNMNCYMILC